MPVAFAIAANDDGFETYGEGKSSKETGVAFADSKTRGYGAGWSRGFDGVVEERYCIVCDIVMKPGEDGSCFVGRRREWIGEAMC